LYEHLVSPSRQRTFFGYATLVILILFGLRLFVFATPTPPNADGEFRRIASAVLDNLLSAAIATTCITWALLKLLPERETSPGTVELRGREIREVLEAGVLADGKYYYFRGRSGRFLRAFVLPKLAERARAKNVHVEVHLQILDPKDEGRCELYAEFRNKLGSTKPTDQWTRQRVRNESLATILSAFSFGKRAPLKVTVSVSSAFSLFRLDLSAKAAVITREDPNEPALRCDAGSYLYNSFLEDFRLGEQQARQLETVNDVPALEDLDGPSARSFFKKLSLDDGLKDEDVKTIVDLARSPVDPYS
jgi:hypothetical protein